MEKWLYEVECKKYVGYGGFIYNRVLVEAFSEREAAKEAEAWFGKGWKADSIELAANQ